MKRLAAAVACALLFHAGMFWIGSGWFMSRTVPPSISRFVTVTMSYRAAQEQAAGARSAEAGPRDMPAPDRPGHRPAVEKSAKPRSAQPSEKESVSRSEHENVQDAGQENASDAAGQQEAAQGAAGGGSGMGGSGTGMVREAIPLYKVNPPPRLSRSRQTKGRSRARSYSACMWMRTAAFQTCGCLNQAATYPLILRLFRRSKTGFLSPACRAAARLPCGSTCRSGLN